MNRILLVLLCLIWGSAEAGEPSYYDKGTAPPLPPKNPILYAAAYGHCTWDSTHDVASCINSAIAKAAAVGGGTVMVPCGTYGLSSQILQQTAGVRLQGCGVGVPRDTFNTANFISATRLLWIGSVTANPALLVQTPSGGGTVLTSVDVIGITVDCANLCGTAIRINGVVGSTFVIGGAEAITTNIEFTTPTDLEGSGNQRNEISAFSRSTSGSNSPTGILFDGGCANCFNTSYNVMHILAAFYTKGDGIVFGDSDNNTVEMLKDTPNTGATGTGVVCANSAYTPPNGVAVKNYCRQLRVLHDGSHSTHVTGFQTNSTFTATGGNGGTAALAPLVLATSAGSSGTTSTLTFASTTGALSGESISCGGPVNGVFNGTPVLAVTSTTITVNPAQFVAAVPISTNCTLTYGITQAAQAGSYTLTATSSTLYTLTAPAGGHTQAGITASGGFLTFTDMLIPWTGTPNTNDSWTIVVPTAPQDIAFEDVDKGNSLANPTFELGTTGSYWPSSSLYPIGWQSPCIIGSASNLGGKPPTTAGSSACVLGGNSGSATGTSSIVVGGENDSVTGEAGAAIGGTGLTVSGFGATATGQDNIAAGADSFVTGKGATDRTRFASNCLGGAIFAATGDDQTCFELLHGTGATGSAIRLTNNGSAAGGTPRESCRTRGPASRVALAPRWGW